MKPRLLIALAAAAVVAIIGVAAVTIGNQSTPRTPGIDAPLFADLSTRLNDIRTIAIQSKSGAFTIARQDDVWRVVDKFGYPAPFDKLRALMVGIAELRTIEAKTASPALYPELDVEDIGAPDAKSVMVTLKDSGGNAAASLLIGKQRFGRGGAGGESLYVRKAGDAQAWLVRGRLTIPGEMFQWLDRKLIDLPSDRIRRVTVVQPNGARLSVGRTKPGDKDFAIDQPIPADKKLKSSYEVDSLGNALDFLELEDVRPAQTVQFSADPVKGPFAEIATFDGLVVRAILAEKDGKTWVRFGARFDPPNPPIAADDEAAKKFKLKAAADVEKEAEGINARLGAWAYRLTDYKTQILTRKLADLLEAKAS